MASAVFSFLALSVTICFAAPVVNRNDSSVHKQDTDHGKPIATHLEPKTNSAEKPIQKEPRNHDKDVKGVAPIDHKKAQDGKTNSNHKKVKQHKKKGKKQSITLQQIKNLEAIVKYLKMKYAQEQKQLRKARKDEEKKHKSDGQKKHADESKKVEKKNDKKPVAKEKTHRHAHKSPATTVQPQPPKVL